MSLDRCLFLARTARDDGRADLERRIEGLARFHDGRASWRWAGELVAAGAVRADARSEPLDVPLVFGEPLPPSLAGTQRLLDAPATDLRAIEGSTAALALGPDRACLAGGAGGPGLLFSASSGPIDAWSTHAVAAAWLAHGRARIDPAAIPEQLAAEFVGGDRSLIEGARPLPQAVRVTVDDAGARLDDFWPAAERWRQLGEGDAAAHVERHLLETLGRRTAGLERPHASITAGLDSRVTAVALIELGVRPRTFTWGDPDWDDVRGGAEAAAALELEHRRVELDWLDDDEAMRSARREARWTEGAVLLAPARLRWPASMSAFVTGAGGEVGRSFYYRDAAPHSEEAADGELADTMMRLLGPRLAGARSEAVDGLAAAVRDWIASARAAGHSGWRALDVVYGEQRVARWLRGMLPRLDAPMVPAFATPEVARGLASLPLEDRLSDGFHRRFLEARAPELLPPAPAGPAQPGATAPGPFRRLASRVPGAGRLRPAEPSVMGDRWEARPAFRDWVADGVLTSPLLTEPLGDRWARRTRERFLAGDGEAEATALAAAGPVALSEALEELSRDA